MSDWEEFQEVAGTKMPAKYLYFIKEGEIWEIWNVPERRFVWGKHPLNPALEGKKIKDQITAEVLSGKATSESRLWRDRKEALSHYFPQREWSWNNSRLSQE